MDYRPRHIIMMMITVTLAHHDLYMTFSRESYYPILRTLQCCGLLFKIVGEELASVHYKFLQIQVWNAASELELRGAYIQRLCYDPVVTFF